jgi:hypothetical protein
MVEWAEVIHEHGTEATREAARQAAEADRSALLDAKGADVNQSDVRIRNIRNLN